LSAKKLIFNEDIPVSFDEKFRTAEKFPYKEHKEIKKGEKVRNF
jgi:hypothetical protein